MPVQAAPVAPRAPLRRDAMILVRNVFRLKFGAAKEARKLWTEGQALTARLGGGPQRALVDVTGPFYTFVLEATYASLAAYEAAGQQMMGAEEWKHWYARFTPLVESGYREIFSVVET
jgi:hypothetical protein